MKKVLCLSPYSVIPPQYGGATRIYNIYSEISSRYQVVHFAQQVTKSNLNFSVSPILQQVTPTYVEYSCRNPLNIFLYGIISSGLKYPFTFHSEVLSLSAPNWLRQQVKEADIINVEHPWQFPWVYRQNRQRKPILVTAHNVESVLFDADKNPGLSLVSKQYSKDIERRERFTMQHATRVLTMSYQDAEKLVDRYNISPEKCVTVPNGVDCKLFSPVDSIQRTQRKRELGFTDKTVVLFAGSTHTPNKEAVEKILQWAEAWPDDNVHFLVVGSVGRTFSHIKLSNVTFTGLVEHVIPYFEAADIAINPMISGSGTNLKQVEYMAMGLPSLATSIGARGIDLVDGYHGFISDIENFPNKLRWLINKLDDFDFIRQNSRLFAKENFDWQVISQRVVKVYRDLGC